MVIGIDIDGVITNLLKSVKKEYLKFSKLKNGKVKLNKNASNLGEYFGVTKEQDYEFFKSYTWAYAENVRYYSSAKKYMNLLIEKGHKLYIITLREYAGQNDELGEKMRNIVESSLKKNGIVYDKIFYTSVTKSKVPVILEQGVQVLIDDSRWNLSDASKHVPVICFNQVYNQSFAQDGLMRAKNWKDVYNIIEKLERNNK